MEIGEKKVNPLGKTIKNAGRLRQIVSVFAKHGFENFAERARLGRFLFEKITKGDVEHYSVPERLRMSFEELGPAFIKLGQLLATRPDLIPVDFCEEFKKLHDQVTTLDFTKIEPVLTNHFNQDVNEVFSHFDTTPIGAASIAQVYKATLKTGEHVVVKVQRPGVVDIIFADLSVLYTLAELVDAYIPEARIYNPKGIVDEFFKSLKLETNFVVEANNMRKFKNNFLNNAKIEIPKVYTEYLGEQVLVMEKLEGYPLSNPLALKQEGINSEALIKIGIECYFKMVFQHGFFHGDMHPGNLFVLPDGKLGLIDFGVVGRLNPRTKNAITEMLIALATEDYDRLAYEYVDLAPYNEHTDVDQLSRQLRDLISPYFGLNLGEVNTGRLLLDTTSIAAANNLSLPTELVVFFKSIINIESLGKMIKQDFDVLAYSLEFAKEVIQTKYDPTRMVKEFSGVARDTNNLLQSFPRHIKQVLRKWNSPDYSIKLNVYELKGIKKSFNQASSLIFLGLIIGCLILSSSMIVANTLPGSETPVLSIVGYGIACALGVVAFVNYIRR